MRSRADCSSYHAGAWRCVLSWRLLLAGASIICWVLRCMHRRPEWISGRPASPSHGDVAGNGAETADQAVPATASRARRAKSAVQPNQPVTAATGVTPGSASSGRRSAAHRRQRDRISGEELNARPAARVGELLEAVPGLIVTQHSGEGKANQYFLRGFNLDHGTDWPSRSTACRSTCRPMAMARAMRISTS